MDVYAHASRKPPAEQEAAFSPRVVLSSNPAGLDRLGGEIDPLAWLARPRNLGGGYKFQLASASTHMEAVEWRKKPI
jgi:hypothetical protein